MPRKSTGNTESKPRRPARTLRERIAAMKAPTEKKIEDLTKKRDNALERAHKYDEEIEALNTMLAELP